MLKLNCGFSRKVGEPDFGSRGATVNLELEVDSSVIREPEKLQERIEYLFRLAKRSVDTELIGDRQQADNQQNGHRKQNGRHATQSQVRAIHAIANRRQIDLASQLQQRFGVNVPDALSIRQASELIDQLKAPAHPAGDANDRRRR